jgi:ubiquinone/menaquinone biosynthesis C-methylase UbiE
MSTDKEKGDKRFPLFAYDNPLRRRFSPPGRFVEPFVMAGQVAADLGCGTGFYAIALAERVGPGGKVYAVDSDGKAVQAVEKKAGDRGLRNIEARASSAAGLGFIGDATVDFVLAHGLLCSMAPGQRDAAVGEIKRILKPGGRAYISVARGPWSYIDRAAWEKILEGFRVDRRGRELAPLADRWAVVSLLKQAA